MCKKESFEKCIGRKTIRSQKKIKKSVPGHKRDRKEFHVKILEIVIKYSNPLPQGVQQQPQQQIKQYLSSLSYLASITALPSTHQLLQLQYYLQLIKWQVVAKIATF